MVSCGGGKQAVQDENDKRHKHKDASEQEGLKGHRGGISAKEWREQGQKEDR